LERRPNIYPANELFFGSSCATLVVASYRNIGYAKGLINSTAMRRVRDVPDDDEKMFG